MSDISHRPSLRELEAAYADLPARPRDSGRVEMLVIRPGTGARQIVPRIELSTARGIHGDHWERESWLTLDAGAPDPDVQVTLMSRHVLELFAPEREAWRLAGDNLIVDFDLRKEVLPAGTQLAIGTAAVEITEVPHAGCAAFVESYGRDACAFVNRYREERRRGVYARVIRDGSIAEGDAIARMPANAT